MLARMLATTRSKVPAIASTRRLGQLQRARRSRSAFSRATRRPSGRCRSRRRALPPASSRRWRAAPTRSRRRGRSRPAGAASSSESAPRQSEVVGWVPVPKAMPGIEHHLDRAGGRRARRSRWAARRPGRRRRRRAPSSTPRPSRRRGSRPARPGRPARPPPPGRLAGSAKKPMRMTRPRAGLPVAGHGARPASRSSTPAAPSSKRSAVQASASSAGSSAVRDQVAIRREASIASAPVPSRPYGLYVHFPWCSFRCPYCDFAVTTTRPIPGARYAAAVIEEIGRRAAGLRGARLRHPLPGRRDPVALGAVGHRPGGRRGPRARAPPGGRGDAGGQPGVGRRRPGPRPGAPPG